MRDGVQAETQSGHAVTAENSVNRGEAVRYVNFHENGGSVSLMAFGIDVDVIDSLQIPLWRSDALALDRLM